MKRALRLIRVKYLDCHSFHSLQLAAHLLGLRRTLDLPLPFPGTAGLAYSNNTEKAPFPSRCLASEVL
jgi:hypothetical protein